MSRRKQPKFVGEVELNEFDFDQMKLDRIMAVCGRRGSGKSTFINYVMWYLACRIPVATVFSGTESTNGAYHGKIPDFFVHGEWDPEVVGQIMERQEQLMLKDAEGAPIPIAELIKIHGFYPGLMLVADDCMYDKKILETVLMRQVFCNGRHYKLFFLLVTQYMVDIKPDKRGNVDYFVLTRETREVELEKLHRNIASVIPSYDLFKEIMKTCTSDFGVLIIDNTCTSENWQDAVFYFNPPEHLPAYRCGSQPTWDFQHSQARKIRNKLTEMGGPKQKASASTTVLEDPGESAPFRIVKKGVVHA